MRVAALLDEHNKPDRSESIYTEILDIRRRVWGQGHELTAIATIALGNNLRKQDKLEEAERLTGKHSLLQRHRNRSLAEGTIVSPTYHQHF